MQITVHRANGCIRICSFDDFQQVFPARINENKLISWTNFAGEWEAKSFVHRYFHDAYEIGQLRMALAKDVYDLARWTDEDVISTVAHRLTTGVWRIIYEIDPAPAVVPVTRIGPQSISSGRGLSGCVASSAPAADRVRPLAPAAGSASRLVEMTAPPVPEWPEASDQLAQAETLEQAAHSGTPFCEICAKRQAMLQEGRHE